MNEDEIVQLQDIFYEEAPDGYDLVVTQETSKNLLGVCVYREKVCIIFGPESYGQGMATLLHEIAHANIQHETHSDTWEKEYVRLLRKYKVDPKILEAKHIIGPNVQEYIRG